MKVTVCELENSNGGLERDWQRLAEHVRSEHSEFVLLPETPFSPWLPRSANFKAEDWSTAVQAHERWESRLRELAPAAVLGTRPVDFGNERYNVGFVWTASDLMRTAHTKSQLTDSAGCWESVWYHRAAEPDFTPIKVQGATVGFLIGPELSATDEVERYGREGAQILVSPRSAPVVSIDAWLELGRAAARVSGVHELCSTRAGEGPGWIINPSGEVIAQTSATSPFVSRDIQLPPAATRQ